MRQDVCRKSISSVFYCPKVVEFLSTTPWRAAPKLVARSRQISQMPHAFPIFPQFKNQKLQGSGGWPPAVAAAHWKIKSASRSCTLSDTFFFSAPIFFWRFSDELEVRDRFLTQLCIGYIVMRNIISKLSVAKLELFEVGVAPWKKSRAMPYMVDQS